MKWLSLLLLLTSPLSSSKAVSVDTSSQTVRVVVDPRIELMGVVQLLNDYMLTTKYDFSYKRDVQAYFSQYRDHAAVTMFSEMSSAEFNFDAVPTAMLAISDPPELELRTPFSEYAVKRAGGEVELESSGVLHMDYGGKRAHYSGDYDPPRLYQSRR